MTDTERKTMAGVNKCIFVGNLGRDPEIRYLESGAAIAAVSLGVSETWKDKDGEKQEKTEWVRVIFFGKLAEIVQEYLSKGSQIYVEGKLRTRKYQDKDGNDKFSTEVVANEMRMLSSRKNGDTPAQAKPVEKPVKQAKQPVDPEIANEDIPF